MASVTILNISNDPISIELYYLQKSDIQLKLKLTDFFGPTKYKTIRYPDNCSKITISIIKDIPPGISHYIASVDFSASEEKFLKFISYTNDDFELIETTINDIKNIPIIKFQNKTLNRLKVELNFNFHNKLITTTNLINKNRSLSLSLPNNINNIQTSLFYGNTSLEWNLIKTFILKSNLSKSYAITRNTSKFSLNEI